MLGNYDIALEYGMQAVSAAGERDPGLRALALYEMGQAHRQLDHIDEAARLWRRALSTFETIHHRYAHVVRAELSALERDGQRPDLT